jgi:glycosyltransferase involved in cell wall biosynthesis
VIPGFFETEKFPQNSPEDYIVYVGRLVPKKGLAIACQAAENAGVKLKLIGHGDVSTVTYGELLGPLPEDERNEVVSKARALICPTVYVEPFGCIGPEAMLSGVPVISTDFGGFTETVEHGVSGYRCNLFGEFVDAIGKVDTLDRSYIRARAQKLYSLEAAATSFAEYFRRISTMWGVGWATCPYEVAV